MLFVPCFKCCVQEAAFCPPSQRHKFGWTHFPEPQVLEHTAEKATIEPAIFIIVRINVFYIYFRFLVSFIISGNLIAGDKEEVLVE